MSRKKDLEIFVVVIPKEGMVGPNPALNTKFRHRVPAYHNTPNKRPPGRKHDSRTFSAISSFLRNENPTIFSQNMAKNMENGRVRVGDLKGGVFIGVLRYPAELESFFVITGQSLLFDNDKDLEVYIW